MSANVIPPTRTLIKLAIKSQDVLYTMTSIVTNTNSKK